MDPEIKKLLEKIEQLTKDSKASKEALEAKQLEIAEGKASAEELVATKALVDEQKSSIENLVKEMNELKLKQEKMVSIAADAKEASPYEGEYGTGLFFQDVAVKRFAEKGMNKGLSEEKAHNRLDEHQKSFNTLTGNEGGALVGHEVVRTIMSLVSGRSRVWTLAQALNMTSGARSIELPRLVETSREDGSRGGGITALWKGEAAAIEQSDSENDSLTLKLKKLTGSARITEELLGDVGVLSSWIPELFAKEFAFKLDDASIWGDGVGKPLGFMNSGAIVTVPKETTGGAQAADTIVAQNCMNMWTRLYFESRENAVWLVNQDIYAQLMQMALAVGSGGVPVWMPANNISGRPFMTLFGAPIIEIEQAETIGTSGDIMLVDMKQYLTLNRPSKSSWSEHVRFMTDEMTFKMTQEVDGQPRWSSTLTPYKGTNTTSPFIVLASRD